MRITLEPIETACYNLIFHDDIRGEVQSETVIPDAKPDAAYILDVQAQVLARSKELSTGKISAEASVRCGVVYAAEGEEGCHCVQTELPIEFQAAVPSADENCFLMVSYELCSVEAKLINSRKLLLTANICCRICCYQPGKFTVWEKPKQDKCGIQYLSGEAEHWLTVGVREKTFSVTDEYSASSGKSEESGLLSTETQICILEAKTLGKKLIIKATAKTQAVFTDGEQPFRCVFESPFSQLIELDDEEMSQELRLQAVVKEVDFTRLPDREGLCYAAAFSVCIQTACCRRVCSGYICDAYSNEYELSTELTELKLISESCTKILRPTLKIMLPSEIEPGRVLYFNVAGLCLTAAEGGFECRARINAVYCDEGGTVRSQGLELTGRETAELCPGGESIFIPVCNEEPECSRNGQLSMSVAVQAELKKSVSINALCAVEYDEQQPTDVLNRPSATVLCSSGQADLWQIAKKYGSTRELIRQANTQDGTFDEDRRPLLIPTARN